MIGGAPVRRRPARATRSNSASARPSGRALHNRLEALEGDLEYLAALQRANAPEPMITMRQYVLTHHRDDVETALEEYVKESMLVVTAARLGRGTAAVSDIYVLATYPREQLGPRGKFALDNAALGCDKLVPAAQCTPRAQDVRAVALTLDGSSRIRTMVWGSDLEHPRLASRAVQAARTSTSSVFWADLLFARHRGDHPVSDAVSRGLLATHQSRREERAYVYDYDVAMLARTWTGAEAEI